jgi:hypothetical protein
MVRLRSDSIFSKTSGLELSSTQIRVKRLLRIIPQKKGRRSVKLTTHLPILTYVFMILCLRKHIENFTMLLSAVEVDGRKHSCFHLNVSVYTENMHENYELMIILSPVWVTIDGVWIW